jgi:hypothetical protein
MKMFLFVTLLACLLAVVVGQETNECKKCHKRKYQKCLADGFEPSIENCVGANADITEKRTKKCTNIENKLKDCGYTCPAPEPAPEPLPEAF